MDVALEGNFEGSPISDEQIRNFAERAGARVGADSITASVRKNSNVADAVEISGVVTIDGRRKLYGCLLGGPNAIPADKAIDEDLFTDNFVGSIRSAFAQDRAA